MKAKLTIAQGLAVAALSIGGFATATSFGLSSTEWYRGPGNSRYLKSPADLVADTKLAAAGDPASRLDYRNLIKTFDDEFTNFSWYADGLPGGPSGGGIWRTHYGYAGVQDRNSRTLESNGEQQIFVDSAFRGTASAPLGLDPFRIVDGVLEIIADRASERIRPYVWNYAYTSGIITTRGTFSQQYGVFEVRARVPKGPGLWSCVSLLPAAGGWPPELNILEILGNQPTTLVTTWHSMASGKNTMGPVSTTVPDTSADFHVYAVDWDESWISLVFRRRRNLAHANASGYAHADVSSCKLGSRRILAWKPGFNHAISCCFRDRLGSRVQKGHPRN